MERSRPSCTRWRSPPRSVPPPHPHSELALGFVSLLSPTAQFAAAGPGTDAAAESTLPIESMKESQSLELEPSVSTAIPAEAERAATMPAEPLRAQTVLQEGLLGRKHSAEGSGKKSSNRSARTRSANHGTGADPASSSPQVVEQPLLRPETGPALGLQGRQELGPGGHLPRRGAPEPGQRQLGDPQQLQEEEARLQAAVSHAHVCRHAGAGGPSRIPPSTHSRHLLLCLQPRRRQRISVPVQRRGEFQHHRVLLGPSGPQPSSSFIHKCLRF